ncbi:MAG: hypothetical protein JW904_08755 [Spirochaetales bacterium]|nr:hypothetical protein [Spirochaetales bacterium]
MGKGPISSELVQRLAVELSSAVKHLGKTEKNRPDSKSKKKLQIMTKQVTENYLPWKKKYESIKYRFKGRNIFSKTDEDATFMRMKDDHMRNGQLKPGYNIKTMFIKMSDIFFGIKKAVL